MRLYKVVLGSGRGLGVLAKRFIGLCIAGTRNNHARVHHGGSPPPLPSVLPSPQWQVPATLEIVTAELPAVSMSLRLLTAAVCVLGL